jgi:hypothetical protein
VTIAVTAARRAATVRPRQDAVRQARRARLHRRPLCTGAAPVSRPDPIFPTFMALPRPNDFRPRASSESALQSGRAGIAVHDRSGRQRSPADELARRAGVEEACGAAPSAPPSSRSCRSRLRRERPSVVDPRRREAAPIFVRRPIRTARPRQAISISAPPTRLDGAADRQPPRRRCAGGSNDTAVRDRHDCPDGTCGDGAPVAHRRRRVRERRRLRQRKCGRLSSAGLEAIARAAGRCPARCRASASFRRTRPAEGRGLRRPEPVRQLRARGARPDRLDG